MPEIQELKSKRNYRRPCPECGQMPKREKKEKGAPKKALTKYNQFCKDHKDDEDVKSISKATDRMKKLAEKWKAHKESAIKKA